MTSCCKVGRTIDAYDLQHGGEGTTVDEYLRARWLGRGDYSSTGLRPLTDWFNRKLLKRVYSDHDRSTLGNRIDADYETLTGDGSEFELHEDLEADGIDGAALQSDFVSTSTLYRHLTDCLDTEKATTDESDRPSNWEAEKIEYARDIVRRNVGECLQSLANKGRVAGGADAEIKTDIVLGCPDCPTQVSLERAIDRGYVCADHMGTETSEKPATDGPETTQ